MSKYEALFVSETVHARDVTLSDGSVHPLHFKELPAAIYRRFLMAERSDDEEVRAGSIAKLIAASLCEADGNPAMTYTQALKLKASAADKLFTAVLEVNGMGAEKPGNGSPPAETSGSGTPSPSPSAAEQ